MMRSRSLFPLLAFSAGLVMSYRVTKRRKRYDFRNRKPLGSFASDLLAEIKADSNVLRELAERAGTNSSSVKDLTAWIGEKVAKCPKVTALHPQLES